MSKNLNDIEATILDRIINRFIWLWLGLSVLGLLMQLKRAHISSMDWVEMTQAALMLSVWVLAFFRNKLSLFVKSTLITVVSGGIAYIGIYKYGLMAAGFSIIPMTALIIGMYYQSRAFWCFFAFNVVVLSGLAWAYSQGHVVQVFSQQAISMDVGHWMVFILTSIVVVFFIGMSLLEYKRELSEVVETLSQQHKKMKKLASYDQLTGLSLMTFAEKKIEKLIAKRVQHSHVAVMFLDVDNFKTINDHYGHEAGDCCLQFVAGAIKSIIREGDEACRIGGDEMVVICDKIKHHDDALELSNRLAQKVAAGFFYEDDHIPVSVSIGVSIAPYHSTKFSELRRCADFAMYQAKKNQERHVVMYSR